ncbi:MAG: ABC transporter substrate-binding protein [Thermomicrobiales bacterium]
MPIDDRTTEPTTTQPEIARLMETFRKTCPNPTRRDLMRWSAIATAAVAANRMGVGSSSAAPTSPTRSLARYQDNIVTDAKLTIPYDPWGQTVTLDPHHTVNWGPFWVMFPNVWGGLLRYNENGGVENDLCESYEVSDDGETYTFKIKPDLKFASGNPVNADAFISSWLRALDPANPSPMADFMALVEGYDDYVAGNSTEIGFQKIDDLTVAISLNDAYSFFPSLLAAYVCRRWSIRLLLPNSATRSSPWAAQEPGRGSSLSSIRPTAW